MDGTGRRVIVIGGGGHAKVVISALHLDGHKVEAVFDDDHNKWGHELMGVKVQGPVAALKDKGYEHGILAIGNNLRRQQIAQALNLQWVTIIHPTAFVDPSVKLGAGSVVFAGAVIQPDSSIGEHVIINTHASVDHDCTIGDFAHLAPGVCLAGNVQIGDGAMVGIGSSVIPGVKVGAWSTVGAGGVVICDVPDNTIVVGVPAKVTKESKT